MNPAALFSIAIMAVGSDAGEKPRIALVPIVAGGAAEDASRIRRQLGEILRRYPSASFVETDDLFIDLDAATKPECTARAECFAALLDRIRVGRGLVVVVNFDADPTFVALRLFDAPKRRWMEEEVGSLRPDERDVFDALSRRAERLLDAVGMKRCAELAIRTSPIDASVAIDPPSAAAGAAGTFLVGDGRYVVHASRTGFRPKTAAVEIANGTDAAIAIALDPEEEPALSSSPWFWIGVAAAVVAAAVTAGVVASRSGARCLCIGPNDRPCDC
jgi:hypothetical protein